MFTQVTVTRDYDLATGAAPTGTVSFTPSAWLVNTGVTVVAAPVVAALDVAGAITVDLAANTDPGTAPVDSYYTVQEDIVGQPRRVYQVIIPHDLGSPLDLAALAAVYPRTGPLGRRIAFGAYANTGGTAQHAALESTLGVTLRRYVTYLVMGTGGTSAWPTSDATWCASTGHDLVIAWDILSSGPTFATILSGGNNASLDAFFTAAKNHGWPVYLRMWWEMNDANGPTKVDNASSTLFASNTVSVRRTEWINAWRYVYNRCKTTIGANNVKFFFCANGSDTGATTIEQLFPGAQYVDYVGLNTYNETTFASWTNFTDKIAPMMNRVATLAPNTPQGIGELGTVNTGGPGGTSKATWIDDMFATADWPRLQFIDWFSVNQTNDWRLDQTPASIAAVQKWLPALSTP